MPVRFQVASDVIRDGLGVELVDEDGRVVAEVFRHDASHKITITCFEKDIDLSVLEMLIARGRQVLEPFEDGTPLSQAKQ